MDSAAVRLRDWLLTPEGQALVKESGYVPAPRI
jgi:ABC-type Fe3+ transport system substrate-binding protein